MNNTIHLNGWVFLGTVIMIAVAFFLIGRYLFFTETGIGIAFKRTIQPQKTLNIRDFKRGDIYKAMSSQLKRNGSLLLMSDNIEQSKKKIANAGGLKAEQIKTAKLEGNNYKLSIR